MDVDIKPGVDVLSTLNELTLYPEKITAYREHEPKLQAEAFCQLTAEEFFRGYLLPRMNRAFGRGDWVVNGLLFTGYHLHVPWAMPATLFDTLTLAYPTKRYRSAWMGIAVHSAQSVFFAIVLLLIVL